jgi:hypothetical protein
MERVSRYVVAVVVVPRNLILGYLGKISDYTTISQLYVNQQFPI